LKGTPDDGICIRAFDGNVIIFVDASWGEDILTGRSTTGYVCFMGGPVAWNSTLQRSSARSTMEAEYMALADAVAEAYYLMQFIGELFPKRKVSPAIIYEDNQPCIKLAESHTIHKKAKHIRLRYHFIRDAVNAKDILLIWIPSSKMVADLLTKAPSMTIFKNLQGRLMGHIAISLD
jgi:hypothetical protein